MKQPTRISIAGEGGLRASAHLLAARIAGAACIGPARGATGRIIAMLGGIDKRSRAVLRKDGFELSVAMSDGYWMAAGISGRYESDVESLLRSLPMDRRTIFLDCGANIGWWSLFAEKSLGWEVIAIEADADLVSQMKNNRSRNEAKFEVRELAIWSSSGETMKFCSSEFAHAGNHLSQVAGFVALKRLPKSSHVRSITIDDALRDVDAPQIVIKLDVEGAEAQAFEGSRRTIERGAVFIFEDHGADVSCRAATTAFAMGLKVSWLDNTNVVPMASVDNVRRVKTSRRVGYNFIALRSSSMH